MTRARRERGGKGGELTSTPCVVPSNVSATVVPTTDCIVDLYEMLCICGVIMNAHCILKLIHSQLCLQHEHLAVFQIVATWLSSFHRCRSHEGLTSGLSLNFDHEGPQWLRPHENVIIFVNRKILGFGVCNVYF